MNRTLLFLSLMLVPLLAVAQPAGAPNVIAAPVKTLVFYDQIEALGTTRANETVAMTATVTETVSEIHFQDGQSVEAGQLLLVLDKSEEEADLAAARALLSEREASFKRAQELEGTQAISTAILQERQALLKQIRGDIQAIEARLNNRMIRAPFDGILGLRNVSVGTLVTPGQVITTIDDLDPIKVDFDVPSLFLSTLIPGLPVEGEVDAYPGRTFRGEVQSVNTQIDPVTRTVKVRALVPNEQTLIRPGLLMTVTLFNNPRQTLVIPEEALIQRGREAHVFIVDDSGEQKIARRTTVRAGQRRPGSIEILDGLKAGQLVITHGSMTLSDGQNINVQAVEDRESTVRQLIEQKSPQPGAV